MNRETRSETIARFIRLAINTDARLNQKSYAARVADAYHAAVPLHLRTIHFGVPASAEDFERVQAANAKEVARFVNAETRMPVDIEEFLIDALPDTIREQCNRALAARRGFLAVPMPSQGSVEQIKSVACLMRATGTALDALAPMFHDGIINQEDKPYAQEAHEKLTQLIAQATSLLGTVEGVMHTPSNVHPLRIHA